MPAGAKLYLCPWVVHRDPRFYPEPDRFDPRRFTHQAMRHRPHFAYFPFGAGPRICIGEHLAMLEGVMALAVLLPRRRFQPPARPPVPDPGLILRPRGGLTMRVNMR